MSLVEEFYKDAQKEWDRLLPLCRIEFASTLGLIETYITRGLRVADIGGGTGRWQAAACNPKRRCCERERLDVASLACRQPGA